MGNHLAKLRLLESTQICCTGQVQKQAELRLGEEEIAVTKSPAAFTDFAHDREAITHSTAKASTAAKSLDFDLKSEDRIQRISEAVHFAKLLILKVASSKVLSPNTEIAINALGIEGSRRNARDGVVYFGNKLKCGKGPGQAVVNDVKIPASDQELAEKHRGRHFQIAYDPYTDKYYIKDLSVGFGAFARLDFPLALKDNHLVHIGESFIVVNMIYGGAGSRSMPRLRLKLFGGPCTGEVFFFNVNDARNSQIRVGRMFNCEIQIEDSLISKYQSTILYDSEQGWVLLDGDAVSGRRSTNGTW